MESIRHEEKVITDGKAVAELITSFFAKWFARLPAEKERDRILADCVIRNDKNSWDSLIGKCSIPLSASDPLWAAFCPKPLSDEGKREALELENYIPTFTEFKQHIETLNPRSAAGFSGLSYLMV
jgi:hypothetical protein